MLQSADLDTPVSWQEQFADTEDVPIVLMILFTVKPADAAAFQRAWAEDAAFFKAQPGVIAAQLHQGLGGSPLWLDCAVFENVAALRATSERPEFAALRAAYPDSATARMHLFRRVAVPNICTGEVGGAGPPRPASPEEWLTQQAAAAEIERLRARVAELERRK